MGKIEHSKFSSLSLPTDKRIGGFETFMKGSSVDVVGEYNRLFFEALGGDNPNFVELDRLGTPDLGFSVTNTSGLIMGADRRKRQSSIIVSLVDSGNLDIRTPKGNLSLKTGDIYVNAGEKDFQIQVGPGKTTRIMLPLGIMKEFYRANGNLFVVRDTNPLADILKTTITVVEAELRSDRIRNIRMLSKVTQSIIGALAAEEKKTSYPDRYALLRVRARAFVEDNIASFDLNVEDIADHVHASRATLYRAFAKAGGVRHLINQTRLDAARDMIEAQDIQRGSLTDIAYECGFTSTGGFTRAFKKRFGMLPSEFARTSLPDSGGSD